MIKQATQWIILFVIIVFVPLNTISAENMILNKSIKAKASIPIYQNIITQDDLYNTYDPYGIGLLDDSLFKFEDRALEYPNYREIIYFELAKEEGNRIK